MRGVARVIENPLGHGRFDWAAAQRSRRDSASARYTHAFVLPNSWKSALIPWLAGIPRRIGYVGEARWGLLNDARRLDRKALPRLVDRFAALALPPRRAGADAAGARSWCPTPPIARGAMQALDLRTDRPIAVLCPGAEYGPAKRWPPEPLRRTRRAAAVATACRSGSSARPTTRLAADVGAAGGRRGRPQLHDLTGRTDLGTAIDLLSLAQRRRQQRLRA